MTCLNHGFVTSAGVKSRRLGHTALVFGAVGAELERRTAGRVSALLSCEALIVPLLFSFGGSVGGVSVVPPAVVNRRRGTRDRPPPGAMPSSSLNSATWLYVSRQSLKRIGGG